MEVDNTNTQKGKQMKLNLEAVLSGSGFEGLGGAVKAAMERHQEAVQEKLTHLLVDALGQAEDATNLAVQEVRRIRKLETAAKGQLVKVSRAADYLAQSGNPLPLFRATCREYRAADFCQQLGVPVPDMTDPMWSVPDDFKAE